jgi:hypothetical protein
MKRWKIGPYEFLVRFLKQGLIVYSIEGRELSPEELFDGIADLRADKEIVQSYSIIPRHSQRFTNY